MGSGIFIAHYLNDRTSLEFQGPLLDGGPEYYGFMWLLFEMLGDVPDHRLSYTQLKGIAHQCFSTPEKVKAFIASAVEADLFQGDDEGFWCDELNRRFGHSLDAMPLKKRKVQGRILDSVKRGGEKEYPGDFEEFWAAYPRREGKVKAYEQYMINVKNGCSAADMMASARNYARSREGEDVQYTLMPSTFLGPSQRWIEYVKGGKQATTVAEKPKVVRCPVCDSIVPISTATACFECGFAHSDFGNKEKIEAHKKEYERQFVPVDPINLMDILHKKLSEKSKAVMTHGY